MNNMLTIRNTTDWLNVGVIVNGDTGAKHSIDALVRATPTGYELMIDGTNSLITTTITDNTQLMLAGHTLTVDNWVFVQACDLCGIRPACKQQPVQTIQLV